MNINKEIDCVAFHEAGHAVAHHLTGIPFNYVTIKADVEKDEYGQRSLGYIEFEKPISCEKWDQYSILNPKEFDRYFKDDFIKLSGFVAEMMYRGRFNYKSSKADFRQWVGTSLIKLPEKLSSKYQSLMLEYTFHVLQSKTNWSNITATALSLVDNEILSYDQFLEVIKQNAINPILK